MLLKTQSFGKKGKLSNEEKVLAYFARIFVCDKPQGTKCKGPKGNLTIIVKAIRSIL